MTRFAKEEPTVQLLYYSSDNQETPQHGQMDDVLDHIRTLHDSRDLHGYLSLLVSTRGGRIFGMRFPFYYELKIAFVAWLLSPYTKGSSLLYRKFVHPTLSSKEKEIDDCLIQAKDRSYDALVHFGKRGLNVAATAAVMAASKTRLNCFQLSCCHDIAAVTLSRTKLARICVDMLQT
ncbi:hypothetical protein BTVI_83099 [Pitangus sulphuratus]|nr:hypothetical protein BTVI_83099 [Pitangus sulphuratus]